MKAPKCRTCGIEHWGSICVPREPAKKSTAAPVLQTAKRVPKAAKSVGTKAPMPIAPAVDASKLIVATDHSGKDETVEAVFERQDDGGLKLLSLTARGTPRKRAPKGTFDRKAYQREAARKRRAAAKESIKP